ncbi:MAG: BMP family ABC transporter substrate-binding protein [Solobacterium sp.]|nr:BMP family ABC transporter substrate-binding protein [Solobacterium sp.]
MTEEYIKARKEGMTAFRKAVLKGEYPYVQALDEIEPDADTLSAVNIGTIEIPISLITGTKTAGRQGMFAPGFLPIADEDTEFALKWASLYRYQIAEGISDAVIVYEYKHRFYVREGNKRVSVLKYLDMPVILAEVTRLMPKEPDELYEEFLEFYRCAPLYEICFSHKGDYRKLASLLGLDLKNKWDEKTVRRLKGAWYAFSSVYEEKEDSIAAGDAFLIYSSVYGIADITAGDRQKLIKRLALLRNEFRRSTGEDRTEIREKPDENSQGTLKKILPVIPNIPFIPEKKLNIAFIYDRDPETSAAVFEHELARIVISRTFKEKIAADRFIASEEELAGILESCAKKYDMIFTVSPLQMNETFRCAVRHPDRKFLNHSLYQTQNAVRTYDVKMYEVKFLLGALAAVYARDHRIAYIADVPLYGTIAEINAFAIGASFIDPNAEIILGWSETTDQDWRRQMEILHINVFSGAQLPDFQEDNTEYGLYTAGDEGIINIAAPVIHWEKYYEKIIRSVLDETWQSAKDRAVSYWWGMDTGITDINISGQVPYQTQRMIGLLKNALARGTLDPFDGELRTRDRVIRGAYDPALTNRDIITMNWLNDNVTGIIPDISQLNEGGRLLAEAGGVRK